MGNAAARTAPAPLSSGRKDERPGGRICNVVMRTRRMVNAVLAATSGAPLQKSQLRN
ncbi:hypothetical protein ACVWWG_007473 [Bradyrhizobium sp. LB7.2]